jgi:hypothetical protein
MGYAAIQFLPDLQAYRSQTEDFLAVVNGYEEHEHIYQHLENYGGTVLIRGRGIVASRIVQRISEIRQRSPRQKINLLHLMRSPKALGNSYGRAQRPIKNHYEFQPFNWPKGTWGGDMRTMLEAADPLRRRELLQGWGGTTTASRKKWRDIVRQGIAQKWYEIRYGLVTKLERNSQGQVITHVVTNKGQKTLTADFVIDNSGRVGIASTSPAAE